MEDASLDVKQLRGWIQARYPMGVVQGSDGSLGVDDFLDVEALLTLAVTLEGEGAKAERAHVLLSNYALLRPEAFGADEHLMQSARRALLHLSSAMAWHRCLRLYQKDVLADLRMFDLVDGCISIKERYAQEGDRRPVYLRMLLNPERRARSARMARAGEVYQYFCRRGCGAREGAGAEEAGHTRMVSIPATLPAAPGAPAPAEHRGPRERIAVSLEELIKVAEEVCEKAGRPYYVQVLQRIRNEGLLKAVRGRDLSAVHEISINRVCSLVGLVGAGKSVFANALIVALARRGCKVVSLLNSVSDVMECVQFLRDAGVAASPLVSQGERMARLDQLFSQGETMLMASDVARYLETPCILDGLSYGDGGACSYSHTPCFKLLDKKGEAHACPYGDVCPSQAMAREALTSDVVITTPAGFAMMMVEKRQRAFFEHVLASCDLVIFDEADRVQAQLDSAFAPEMSFQDLIYHAADPIARAMKRRPVEKMRDLDVEAFYDLRQSCEPVAKSLLASARRREVKSWSVVRTGAFTSLTLLDALARQGLPEKIARELERRVRRAKGGNPLLGQAIALSCQGVDEGAFAFALKTYLDARGATLDDELRERFAFVLKVIRFDEYLRELAASSDFLTFKDDSIAELYRFLRFSSVRQQRYLPTSLIGNLFGLRMTDDNNLVLFRQFAYGRAFMEALPWLDTDVDGAPTGPHVLLLSGSSYEPGNLQHHVNRPVNYLLEAQPWIAGKLEQAVIKDLGIEQYVSGSRRGERSRNLGAVLAGLVDTLCVELDAPDAGKILVIVNGYDEAEDARERLEGCLRAKGRSERVCALTRAPREDGERFMPRSEVYRFFGHPARILVAPALGIERGFNIVDDAGHAAFTTLVFAVRPMGMPHDIGVQFRRLNGLIENDIQRDAAGHGDRYPRSAAPFSRQVRERAWGVWKRLERCDLAGPARWRAIEAHELVDDVIATLLGTVIQLFGRLARLADRDRPAPHVYFADGAFRGPDDRDIPALHTLDELGRYMEKLMHDSDQPAVAEALYGPFYRAFKKGITS